MGVLRAQCNHAVPDRSLPPSCGYQRRSHRRAPEGDRRGWWSELPLRSARYWCGGASCLLSPLRLWQERRGCPYHYGKREADASLVTYPNGAVTPYDPNLAVATNAHLATRFGHSDTPDTPTVLCTERGKLRLRSPSVWWPDTPESTTELDTPTTSDTDTEWLP